MRPFDLSEYMPRERSKADSDPGRWPAGAFDYQLSVYLKDPALTDQLCEWLSENCTENFVVSRIESDIIAGGTTNNSRAWKQRHRKSKRNKFSYDTIVKLQIRLHDADVLMFRLAWFERFPAGLDSTSS